MMLHNKFLQLLILLILPALCSGCGDSGPKLAKVEGTVTYKGQPLKSANVKFYPGSGPVAVGITDDNGKFVLNTNGRPGASTGVSKVAITKMSGGDNAPQAQKQMKPEDMMRMAKESMGKPAAGPKSEIPEKYANPDSSQLTADVSTNASENQFTFPLQ